jgi:3-phosphoshikimate 1-carboxyvinyltransferase
MTLNPASQLRGEVDIPGDKSISHRALLLAAIARGRSRIEGRATGADQDSMIDCLRSLGVSIEEHRGVARIHGAGLDGLRSPAGDLDCGNSGATMRFLTGAAAGIEGVSIRLVGDKSLSRRPMERVAEPLRVMGATVATADGGMPPVEVHGGRLRGATLQLDVASAQVKTAVLLAALNATGETAVTAPASRDHTERMLRRLGVDIEIGATIRVRPPGSLPAFEMTVPGDPSAAAFWVVLGNVHPRAALMLHNVCLNPSRTGFLRVLGRMGATVEMSDMRDVAGEAVADITVRSSALHGVEVTVDEVPSLIDEVPVLAVAAATAEGETWFRGVGELRVKEIDRLAAIAEGLDKMGAGMEVRGDDLLVRGGARLSGAKVTSGGDHRMAMSLAVAAAVAKGPTTLGGADAAAVSYPSFFTELERLTT